MLFTVCVIYSKKSCIIIIIYELSYIYKPECGHVHWMSSFVGDAFKSLGRNLQCGDMRILYDDAEISTLQIVLFIGSCKINGNTQVTTYFVSTSKCIDRL